MAVAITLAVVARNNNAYAATVGLPVVNILRVRPVGTEDKAIGSAVSAVICKNIEYNQPKTLTYLSTTTVANIITAMNA